MRIAFSIIPLCALSSHVAAQPDEPASQIEFEGHHFELSAENVRIEDQYGRSALRIENGRIWLSDVQFSDGVIEYDVAFDADPGFAGLMFRAASPRRLEYIYLRAANSGRPDALQYAPVEEGNTAWQIFADPNALQRASYIYDGWNHVRVVVDNDAADVFINGTPEPTLHIPDLKTDIGEGMVGFRAHGPNPVSHISNIVVRELDVNEAVIGEQISSAQMAEGTIQSWSISQRFDESLVENIVSLPDEPIVSGPWNHLAVESNGIINVSRLHRRTPDLDTVLISTRIVSERQQVTMMRFGYADRARIFLNGQLLFSGNATFNSRYRGFLGIIGLHDAITLPLQRGENDLTIALSETFGGWGWTANILEQDGIEIRNRTSE